MNINVLYNSLFIGTLVVFVPVIISFLLSFINFKKINSLSLYVYSFMSSMMLILATLGFMREGYEELEVVHNNDPLSTFINISILSGGVLIGMIITIGIRIIVSKYSRETHLNHNEHNHSDILYNTVDIETKSSFITILWSLIAHKIVAGISLAITLYNSNILFSFENIGMVIILIIHMIPESIMIFYKANEIFNSRTKSTVITLLLQVVIVLFMIIGIFTFNYIFNIYWIMPFINCIAGGSMFFVSIFDLVPEFIHNKNMTTKQWLLTILWFVIGTLFSIIMCVIHHH